MIICLMYKNKRKITKQSTKLDQRFLIKSLNYKDLVSKCYKSPFTQLIVLSVLPDTVNTSSHISTTKTMLKNDPYIVLTTSLILWNDPGCI